MSKSAKKEFLKKKRWEYRLCVNRRQKHELIAELAQTCDYSNKYAIRLLSAKAFPLKEKPKPRNAATRKRTCCGSNAFGAKAIFSATNCLRR